MKNFIEVGKMIKEMVESLGAIVVDVSAYPATKAFPSDPFDVVIVAAYFPETACLFTVDVNVNRNNSDESDFKFVINGEFTELGAKTKWNGRRDFDINRNAVGSESYCKNQFSINDYTGFNNKLHTVEEKIENGMRFYKDFLKENKDVLAKNFTESIHLWYVPEYSNALHRNEKTNGRYESNNYDEFNSKVLQKFPKGIFAKEQYK